MTKGITSSYEDGVLVIRVPVRIEAYSQPSSMRMTERQRQVFERLVQGKCNKEIAAEMNITVRTVAFHVSSLLREFNCETRGELAFKERSARESRAARSGTEELAGR
jgi:DNA-binding NarL/FixJ family response regulator